MLEDNLTWRNVVDIVVDAEGAEGKAIHWYWRCGQAVRDIAIETDVFFMLAVGEGENVAVCAA